MTNKTVTFNEKKTLRKWIIEKSGFTNVKFNLLFKATRDGCSSQTFHNLCDNKGPTVTVVYNSSNYVFGGYTPLMWTSNGTYGNDADGKGFLFRLTSAGTFSPKRYDMNNYQNSIYCHASYGPSFGGGPDMHLFTGTINSSGSYFQGNGTVTVGSTYNASGDNANQIIGNDNKYSDIEVFHLSDVLDELRQAEPWRKGIECNKKARDELLSGMVSYYPIKESAITHVRLLMIGQIGAGKSSFINTVSSAFKGYVSTTARTGTATHSLTTKYRAYAIKDQNKHPLNFKLCDTMGMEEDHGLDVNEYLYIIDGHIKDQFQFNPAVKITPKSPGFVQHPSPAEKIQCVYLLLMGVHSA